MSHDPDAVHVHHCCKKSCKYCDDDCPVVLGKKKGLYACEDCDCLEFNPGADLKAVEWFNTLSPAQKAALYLRETQWTR